jgi:predicted small metal-binding protein
MEITKETVKAVVEEMKRKNNLEEIENEFKNALKFRLIDLDTYCEAMEEIYK